MKMKVKIHVQVEPDHPEVHEQVLGALQVPPFWQAELQTGTVIYFILFYFELFLEIRGLYILYC